MLDLICAVYLSINSEVQDKFAESVKNGKVLQYFNVFKYVLLKYIYLKEGRICFI